MSSERETTRIVRSWLRVDEHESANRVLDFVLDRLDSTPQRRATWWPAWRLTTMNTPLKFGLAAVVVAVAAMVGINYLAEPSVGGPGLAEPTPTATPNPTPTPTPTPEPSRAPVGLPEGPFVVTGTDDPVQVTVNIASSGWNPLPQFDAVDKDDDGLDAPEHVGAALLAWAWPAGTGINVYADPCQWRTTVPETPATTPDEIVADFAAQASTDATTPEDVTVGGYDGKVITLRVPMSYDLPNASRDEKFADCDDATFAYYGVEGETGNARNAQGGGQIDELWILDVDGSIVILDAGYSPATPAELVEELRALAESATFETP
ncbi:MAG: hypothetical protein M3406_00930 [Chloroflexota bacterium]|nr:hypothetical protein [Chloroflexota bacterium]